jgi:hypothetical protein
MANGITKKLTTTKKYMNRSQLRKLPEAVMRIKQTAARGTAMYSLMPKYSRARLTPMNSVAIVKKFKMKRSPTENAPQNLPKRSMISLAWPTPVMKGLGRRRAVAHGIEGICDSSFTRKTDEIGCHQATSGLRVIVEEGADFSLLRIG